MSKNSENRKYEKASADVVYFDNSDVITTSGNSGTGDGPGEGTGCVTWSNQNGVGCYFGLTVS